MASGSWDNTIKLWETSTGTCVSTLTVDSPGEVRAVAFSPDGSKIAAAHSWIQIFDAKTKAKLGSALSGHSRYVTTVSYSCLFSNVWCVLSIVSFTGMSRVFLSVQMVSKWPVEAGTKRSSSGRRRLARYTLPPPNLKPLSSYPSPYVPYPRST